MELNICQFCGKEVHPEAIRCIWCMEYLYDVKERNEQKSFLKTVLFCLFLGGFGVHRFYTGYIGIGILQLLTSGGLGFWAIIDFFSMLLGNYKDINGKDLYKGQNNTNIAGALALAFTILYGLFIWLYFTFPSSDYKPMDVGGTFLGFALIPVLLGIVSIVGDSGKKLGLISIILSVSLVILWFSFAFK